MTDTDQIGQKTAGSVSGGKAPATGRLGNSAEDSGSGDDKLAVTEKQSSSNPGSSSTGSSKPAVAEQKPTVTSIKQKYAPMFENLQSQADGKLNALTERAKKEYSDKKDNGEKIDFGYFYNKYAGAAKGLEAQTTQFSTASSA